MKTMLVPKTRYLAPVGAVAFAIVLFVYGMTRAEHQAYAFPNLFVAAMIAFALLWLASSVTGSAAVKSESSRLPEVAWGLIAIAVYLFAAEWLGFLLSSIIVFFVMGVGYDPDGPTVKGALLTGVYALLFLAVIYGLFNILLKVQTPEGFL